MWQILLESLHMQLPMYNTRKEVSWLARGRGWICLNTVLSWALGDTGAFERIAPWMRLTGSQSKHCIMYTYICKGCMFWSQKGGSRLCWWSLFSSKILAHFLSNALRSLPCWGSLTPSRGQHSPGCACTATCWVSFICFLSWRYHPSWGRRFSEMDRTQVTGSSRKSFPGLFTPRRFRAAI